MEDPISGIQQIGIGVEDARAAFEWYKDNFGIDCRIFEENGEVCPAGWNKGDDGMVADASGVASYLSSHSDDL